MKKLLLSVVVLTGMGLKAQVGINTTDPKASLEVAYDDAQGNKVQAIGLPHVTSTQRDNFEHNDLKDGQLIYNTTTKCVEVCIDKSWRCLSRTVGGTATFGSLSNIEKDVVSFIYGNQPSDKIQGKITATRIPVKIPYTGATAGSVEETILQVEGKPHLKLKIKQAAVADGDGALDAEIYYDDSGDYNLPLVTLNQANAGNYKQATEVVYKVKVKGVSTPATVKVNALGGIPDKKFAEDDAYKFLYLPVRVQANGYDKVWLNMNLGAEAARLGSDHFKINIKKYGNNAHIDTNLYGSYYQWQRPSDGHEKYNSETTPTKSSNWQATAPAAVLGKFITSNDRIYNPHWYENGLDDDPGPNTEQWQAGRANNPCPNGFHVPTEIEIKDFLRAVTGEDKRWVFNNKVFNQRLLPNLAAAGVRDNDGTYIARTTGLVIWGSNSNWDDTNIDFIETHGGVGLDANASRGGYITHDMVKGIPVRCIKD